MVKIRKAKLEDVDLICNIGNSVPEFLVDEKTVNFWPKEIISSAIGSKDTVILVAEDGHAIIGFIIANLNASLKKATIENVYVKQENQNKGVAGKLLTSLIKILKSLEFEYVTTLVPSYSEQAIGLYENAGFQRGKSFLWLDIPITDKFRSD